VSGAGLLRGSRPRCGGGQRFVANAQDHLGDAARVAPDVEDARRDDRQRLGEGLERGYGEAELNPRADVDEARRAEFVDRAGEGRIAGHVESARQIIQGVGDRLLVAVVRRRDTRYAAFAAHRQIAVTQAA
jgi:hypothetical protein